MAQAAYLKPDRLEDIIFLINYLGYEANALEDGTQPDRVVPRSVQGGKWSDIARDHPEFFRLTPQNTCVLALRYYRRNGPALEPKDIQQLVQNAMTLHERQAKRVEVWRGQITILAAVVAALAAVFTGIVGLVTRK